MQYACHDITSDEFDWLRRSLLDGGAHSLYFAVYQQISSECATS